MLCNQLPEAGRSPRGGKFKAGVRVEGCSMGCAQSLV